MPMLAVSIEDLRVLVSLVSAERSRAAEESDLSALPRLRRLEEYLQARTQDEPLTPVVRG